MRRNPFLTSRCPEFDRKVAKTREGQAHFAGTGPDGATCGACHHLGYWRAVYNRVGDAIRTTKHGGCAQFHNLTGKHGPVIPETTDACRYFEPKTSSQ
jgi:hypothetical protein